MNWKFRNNAKAKLKLPLNSTSNLLVLEDGKWEVFPSEDFKGTLIKYDDNGEVLRREIIKVKSRDIDKLEIELRAYEELTRNDESNSQEKTAFNFDIWDYFVNGFYASDLDEIDKRFIENEEGIDSKVDKTDETVTKMGNSFNEAGKLLQLDSEWKIPELDGSNLVGLKAITSNLESEFTFSEDVEANNAVEFCSDWTVKNLDDSENFIWFAKQSYKSGEKGKVVFQWVLDGFEWLEVGKKYYQLAEIAPLSEETVQNTSLSLDKNAPYAFFNEWKYGYNIDTVYKTLEPYSLSWAIPVLKAFKGYWFVWFSKDWKYCYQYHYMDSRLMQCSLKKSFDFSNWVGATIVKDIRWLWTFKKLSRDGCFAYFRDSDYIRFYPLQTPWDIATLNNETPISIRFGSSIPDFTWSEDGRRLYYVINKQPYIYYVTVSNPFDLKSLTSNGWKTRINNISSLSTIDLADGEWRLSFCGHTSDRTISGIIDLTRKVNPGKIWVIPHWKPIWKAVSDKQIKIYNRD